MIKSPKKDIMIPEGKAINQGWPVRVMMRDERVPIRVTMPNFRTLVRKSMKGIPAIKEQNAGTRGMRIGMYPIMHVTKNEIK
jgi:hypothetical protein